MEKELKEILLMLKNQLKSRNNETYSFFDKLIRQLEKNETQSVVDSIATSYSITQYANFSHKEEELLSLIWDIADKLKKSN